MLITWLATGKSSSSRLINYAELENIILYMNVISDFHAVAAGISHSNAEANPLTSTIQSLDVRNSQNKGKNINHIII